MPPMATRFILAWHVTAESPCHYHVPCHHSLSLPCPPCVYSPSMHSVPSSSSMPRRLSLAALSLCCCLGLVPGRLPMPNQEDALLAGGASNHLPQPHHPWGGTQPRAASHGPKNSQGSPAMASCHSRIPGYDDYDDAGLPMPGRGRPSHPFKLQHHCRILGVFLKGLKHTQYSSRHIPIQCNMQVLLCCISSMTPSQSICGMTPSQSAAQ